MKRTIDISGPDGNAFVLLGNANRLAKQLNLDPTAITDEMTSGDYEHLIETFDKYFSDYIVLEK